MTDIACAIFLRNGLFLLVKRAAHKRRFPNCWDLVGGHIEADEGPEQALVREVNEEVGVNPREFRSLGARSKQDLIEGSVVCYHLYLVSEWDGGEPRLLGDEHTEIIWVTADQAANLQDTAHPEWIQIFRELASPVST